MSFDIARFSAPQFQEARTSQWLGRSLAVHARVGSTMDVAFEDAESGASHGHIVIADEQSSARGSHGRTWAGSGHLTFSLVLRVDLPPAACPPLTLAAGLGVADCVGALVDEKVRIKWPNDVLVADRKIAGILSETRGGCIVVGIGLNIAPDPSLDEFGASSLATWGVAETRELVLASLCEFLEARFETHLQQGAAATAAELEARLAWRGEQVTCGDHAGKLMGVAGDGRLILRDDTGLRNVSSGTLRRTGA